MPKEEYHGHADARENETQKSRAQTPYAAQSDAAEAQIMAPSIWIKNPGVRRPLVRFVGRVRRRKSNAALVSDFIALRKPLFLCAGCVQRMPRRWQRRYGYWAIKGFWAAACRCTACQKNEECNIFHPEGGGYLEEHFRAESIQHEARQQTIARRDRRRVSA